MQRELPCRLYDFMEKITAPVYFRPNKLHRHVQKMRKSLRIIENPYQHGFPP